MTETKQFHISDLLSITTGRLVSTRHVDGVYDILNWMTGDNLFTHQLPRASDECKPWLLRWFPELEAANVCTDELDRLIIANGPEQGCAMWIARLGAHEHFDVPKIPTDDHERIHPFDELQMMAPHSEIVPVITRD